MARIGIFAGTFDPVHDGHEAFVRAAIDTCQLDKVVFLPEAKPRFKHNVTPILHRVAMLRLVCAENPKLSVMQLPEESFSVARTWRQLRRIFAGDTLVLMIGSDAAAYLPTWPNVDELYKTAEIVVGQRQNDAPPKLPIAAKFISTAQQHMSASEIREGKKVALLPAVYAYAVQHQLYGALGRHEEI